MLKRIASIIILPLTILFLCGIFTWAFIHRFSPPATWRNPPIYSGAQNVSVQDYGKWGKRLKDTDNFYLIKIVSFDVADDATHVTSYYASTLSNSTWKPDDWGKLDPKSDSLAFSWASSARSPSVYFLDVTATSRAEGGASVQIAVLMFPGY